MIAGGGLRAGGHAAWRRHADTRTRGHAGRAPAAQTRCSPSRPVGLPAVRARQPAEKGGGADWWLRGRHWRQVGSDGAMSLLVADAAGEAVHSLAVPPAQAA